MTPHAGASHRRYAVVVGGSIGGLFAAALLRRKGWDVDVYERSDVELNGRGAGIVSHPELLRILQESGAGSEDLGVHVEERVLLGRNGNVINQCSYPQILTSWDRLQQLGQSIQLKGRYHLNHSFVGFEQDSNGVTAHFSNGMSKRADLLVGADGFRSAVRAIVAPEVQPIYAGYVIWRAVVDEARLDRKTHNEVFRNFSFYLAPGHEVLGYPIAGTDNDLTPGRRKYNFVWYRTIDDARLKNILTDATGHTHQLSIPPPLIRKDVIQEMRATADSFMSEPLLNVLRAVQSAFFTPIYDFASTNIKFGRVVLIGDAAFLARPHVGMGVTKVVADAKSLADSLDDAGVDIDQGLARFEAERLSVGHRVVARGRELGEFLNEGDGTGEVDEKHQNDLLRNTAADEFLYR